MSIQTAWQATFDFWGRLPIIVEPSKAQLTSDAGLLPLRQFDERMANFFRLYLHAAANNLLVRLRRVFADPPPPPAPGGVCYLAVMGEHRFQARLLKGSRT